MSECAVADCDSKPRVYSGGKPVCRNHADAFGPTSDSENLRRIVELLGDIRDLLENPKK